MDTGILQKIKSTEKHVLRDGKNVIGRSTDCYVIISGDIDISRQHAVIEKIDSEFCLCDNKSKHGTWRKKKGTLNSYSRLKAGETHRLSDGDQVRFGHLEFEFKIVDSSKEGVSPNSIVTSDALFYGNDEKTVAGSEAVITEIIGESDSIKAAIKSVRKIAPADLISVLIRGETGTGKGLLAKVLHAQSPRHKKDFVTLNCAGITPELANSELFGHEKGAFTSAFKQRIGYFERANGGTLFLDEIGDMPLDTQAKLLRVLENGQFERVGGEMTLTVDVRIIAATNRNLEAAIDEKTFREDLFYRIKGCQIELLPLRDRKQDVPLLVHHFVRIIQEKLHSSPATVTDEAMEFLENYYWPGNVRELYHAVQSAMVCADELILDLEIFNLLLQRESRTSSNNQSNVENLNTKIQLLIKSEIEKEANPKIIERKIDYLFARSALNHCGGNKSEVQRVFGMSRTTLEKRLNYKSELGLCSE